MLLSHAQNCNCIVLFVSLSQALHVLHKERTISKLDIVDDLQVCIVRASAAIQQLPSWECDSSTSEMYDTLHEAMEPAWYQMYERHGLSGAFWCALYEVRTPIATFIWEKHVCPSSVVLREQASIPSLLMPMTACQRKLEPPPTKILPAAEMYPAGFDLHAFGIFFGHLVHYGYEPLDSILRLFPDSVCGRSYNSSREVFAFRGVTYHGYSSDCSHNLAVHSTIGTLVKLSPEPVKMNLTLVLGLHLAEHGVGHGLFPRFSFLRALQICEERNSFSCKGGVTHSVGNWLMPQTGVRQLETLIPPCSSTFELRQAAARGYGIESFKQSATFGLFCSYDYFDAWMSFLAWAKQPVECPN